MLSSEGRNLFYYLVERDLELNTIPAICQCHILVELEPDQDAIPAYMKMAKIRAGRIRDVTGEPLA